MFKAKFVIALALAMSSASFAATPVVNDVPALGCSGKQPYLDICKAYEAYIFPHNDFITTLQKMGERRVAYALTAPAKTAYNTLLKVRRGAGKDWVGKQSEAMKQNFADVKDSDALKAILKKNKKSAEAFEKLDMLFYAYAWYLDVYAGKEDNDDGDDDSEEDDHDDESDDSSEEDDHDDSEEDDLDDSDDEEDDSDDSESDDSDDSHDDLDDLDDSDPSDEDDSDEV